MEVIEQGSGLRYTKQSASRVHYEDMWSTYKACKDIIQREWMTELKGWSLVEFRGRKKKLDELVDRFKELRFSGEHYNSGDEIKRVKRQI